MKQERRQGPRFSEARGMDVTILSAPDAPGLENRTFACRTRDISAQGLSFTVDAPLPEGAAIELRLKGSQSAPMWHVGSVVWSRPCQGAGRYDVGVQFTRTPEDTIEAWEHLLREKLTRGLAL